jgi:hypothetical protein
MPAGLGRLKSNLAALLRCKTFFCLDEFLYVSLEESKRKKLEIKSKKCILLANLDYGNYRLLELSTRKVHVSRHDTFNED